MSEAVDLSFLSDVERDLILQVLQRDEELRKAEERRIRCECGWGWAGACSPLRSGSGWMSESGGDGGPPGSRGGSDSSWCRV